MFGIFIMRVVRHWSRLPQEVVDPRQRKCSRSGCTRLWAIWYSERCPCLWYEGWS